jgi:hypothetical protein
MYNMQGHIEINDNISCLLLKLEFLVNNTVTQILAVVTTKWLRVGRARHVHSKQRKAEAEEDAQ